MDAPEPGAAPRVTGVVLAAGLSKRFGARLPKQLHEIDGEPLVRRVARAALGSKLERVVVVTGHRAAEVGAAIADLAVEVVVNPDFARGQSTSVRAGLARVGSEADAAMFVPCDLPHLDSGTLDRLLAAYGASSARIVVPTAAGRRRAPVLIDRELFRAVRAISGDEGARQLFDLYEADVLEVGFDSARPFEDVNRLPHS